MNRETRRRALQASGLLLLLGACALFLTFVWRPPCLIYRTTGLYCPGCGGQRMIADLLRGDFAAAFRHNPLLFFLLPAAGLYAILEATAYTLGKPPLLKGRRFVPILGGVLLLSLLFAVLRNLPGFEWLGPS